MRYMKIFKITPEIEVVCDWKKTSYGFKHIATLFVNGQQQESTKRCYYNRTWEAYEYHSVLISIINKSTSLSEEEKKLCLEYANRDHTDWSVFKTTSVIAQLGNLFCDNQKDKNDWKARMIKAGIGNRGLEMPEDWDTLDENTKQARLDGIIKIMREAGQ